MGDLENRPAGRRERQRFGSPSPAMVVAVTALVVASSGTAIAAGVLITSPRQIRDGVITRAKLAAGAVTGDKVRGHTLTGAQIKRGSLGGDVFVPGVLPTHSGAVNTVRTTAQTASQAFEYFRKTGPENQPAGGSMRVLTADNVPAGVYAIFAKTIVTDLDPGANLLNPGKTSDAHCSLGAGGDIDDGRVLIGGAFGSGPGTVVAQITHTFAGPGTLTLTCDATSTWRASDTSIIAVRLGNASRIELPG